MKKSHNDLPSLPPCLRLCHNDCVLLLIVIHELSRRVCVCVCVRMFYCYSAILAAMTLWWGCVACSQVQRVICLSVISMEWNGFSSRAFSLPIMPVWWAVVLLGTCIYLTESWWDACLTHMVIHTHTHTHAGCKWAEANTDEARASCQRVVLALAACSQCTGQ